MLAHKKGYKTIVLVPERTTIDRIHVLKALGTEIIRTQSEVHHDAPESNFSLAKKLSGEITNSIVVDEVNYNKIPFLFFSFFLKKILT